MIFTETKLPGAYVIDLEPIVDSRGFFARAWCEEEFAEHGLETRIAQCNMSFNERKGTLRRIHFQRSPHKETKLVWTGVELSADNRRMLYVPRGFAHGFQTLEERTEIFYMASEFYTPGTEGGVRWNDPAFGIEWPLREPSVISDKDASWPDFAG